MANAGDRDHYFGFGCGLMGDPTSCAGYGWSVREFAHGTHAQYPYTDSDKATDLREAARYLATGCAFDVPLGCRELGHLLAIDYGDHLGAVGPYTRACAAGDREACDALAALPR